jgi:hypothetical protein
VLDRSSRRAASSHNTMAHSIASTITISWPSLSKITRWLLRTKCDNSRLTLRRGTWSYSRWPMHTSAKSRISLLRGLAASLCLSYTISTTSTSTHSRKLSSQRESLTTSRSKTKGSLFTTCMPSQCEKASRDGSSRKRSQLKSGKANTRVAFSAT